MKTLLLIRIAGLMRALSHITDRTAKKLDVIVPLVLSAASVVSLAATIIAKYGLERGAVPAVVTSLVFAMLFIFLLLISN